MEVQPDFRDLLKLFNVHEVKYMIVGGYALAYHGAPRYTGDIDIYIKPDIENAQRIMRALDEFGFGNVGLQAEDFKYADKVIQLGVPPVRIDLITSISDVSWEEAFSGCVSGNYGDEPVNYIGLQEFIKNKKAIGRKKDLSDLEALGI